MAKFYVLSNEHGETIGCFMSQREAMAQGKAYGRRNIEEGTNTGFAVQMVEIAVNAESICKMLAQQGGYAIDSRMIYDGTDNY